MICLHALAQIVITLECPGFSEVWFLTATPANPELAREAQDAEPDLAELVGPSQGDNSGVS